MTQRMWLAPFFLPSIFHDVPVSRCFLGRPQLLTCVPPLPRVIMVIGTRDTVMDRLGRRMERARISIACIGPIRRRRGDRSPQASMQNMRSRGNPKASLEMSATEEYLRCSLLHQNLGAVKQGANCFLVTGKRAPAVTALQGRHRMRSPPFPRGTVCGSVSVGGFISQVEWLHALRLDRYTGARGASKCRIKYSRSHTAILK